MTDPLSLTVQQSPPLPFLLFYVIFLILHERGIIMSKSYEYNKEYAKNGMQSILACSAFA